MLAAHASRSFGDHRNSIESLIARSLDVNLSYRERSVALRAAHALCAAEGSLLSVPIGGNSYWVDALQQQLSHLDRSPASSCFLSDSATSLSDLPAGATVDDPGVVDCLDKLFSPARLSECTVRSGSHSVSILANCPDSGGSMTFLGSSLCDTLRADFPDCIQDVDQCQIAHRIRDSQIGGIGGTCLVIGHVNFTVYIQDRKFLIQNVAVVQGFDSLILGNDFHHATSASIDFGPSQVCYDHPSGRFCTPFTTIRRPLPGLLQRHSPTAAYATSTSVLPSRVLQAEPLATAIRPLAF